MTIAAVYAGTFDPVTLGHADIARRAARAFGALVVLVIPNGNKQPLFSPAERVALLKETFKDEPLIRVEQAEGLLADYLKKTICIFWCAGYAARRIWNTN